MMRNCCFGAGSLRSVPSDAAFRGVRYSGECSVGMVVGTQVSAPWVWPWVLR